MKIVRNNIIPFPGYKAINLFGVIFARKNARLYDITFNHEAIHTAQMKELLYIPFYLIYGIEYLIRLITTFSTKQAYRENSFEREAYREQGNREYLQQRKHYAQWR